MRIKILFWNYNINKGSLMANEPSKGNPLARISRRLGVDLIILADCELPTSDILVATSKLGLDFSATGMPHEKIRFFGRSGGPTLEPVVADDRMVFYRLGSGGFDDILIGGLHLYDRMNYKEPRTRHARVARHFRTLVEAEGAVKHDRTLLVGDFNMTPDEMGMVDSEHAFGALMTWDLAEVQSDPRKGGSPRFFNPMWSVMGRAEAPGSYYWDDTDSYNIFWYCIDGVIARPSLRGIFLEETVRILTTIPDQSDNEIPLVRFAKKHWKIEYSDHLPIVFELELPGGNHG